MIRRAFSANIVPATALWVFASLLLGLYYRHPPTQSALDVLAAFKDRFGLGFSMPAQAFAAAVLPFVFQKFQTGSHRKTRLAHLPFLMLFFALLGGMTDTFYRLQAQIFGDSAQLSVILIKVAVDMLIYTPFISTPLVVLTYALKDNDFSLSKTLEYLGKGWFVTRVLPIYRVGLMVWTPTVAIIYALPLALQFPIQAIVSCLWGLILVILTDK